MSGGNDNVFARWSRRKLAARLDEAHAAPETEPVQSNMVGNVVAKTTSSQPDPTEPDAAVTEEAAGPSEPLPRLEDLTAESDLTAFLRKGVPAALKGAALRKMWSLDPGIRDYVGPSEYAWDFNQAGSMAGFGPLDAKKAVVGFLSNTARAIEANSEPTEATLPDVSLERGTTAPRDRAADVETPVPSLPVDPLGQEPLIGVAGEGIRGEAEPAIGPHSSGMAKPSPASQALLRPRHGGAMPR